MKTVLYIIAATMLLAPGFASAQSIKIVDKNGKDVPTSKEDIKKSIEQKKEEAAKERAERKKALEEKAEKARQEREQKRLDSANKHLNKIGLEVKK